MLFRSKLASQGLEILERAPGIEVDYRPGLSPEELLEAVCDAEGLVIRSGTRVTAELLDAPGTVIWEEAENRLHAQKALMEFLLQV